MPKTNTPSIISEVAMGRRIKGSEMLIGGRLLVWKKGGGVGRRPVRLSPGGARRVRARSWVDASAVGQPVLSVDDDPLAGCEALCHDGNAVLDRGDLDGAPFDRIVRLDRVGVMAVRAALHRLGRHRRDVVAG